MASSNAAAARGCRPRRPTCELSATTSAANRSPRSPATCWKTTAASAFRAWCARSSPMPGRPLATPETEVSSDEWDLGVFGHSGSVSFTRITQHWLRESAKRWAADDLPRRRLRPGRRTSVGLAVRHHVNCLALLSGSLRLRPDRGERPGALERADIETFLNRLAYLASAGRISNDARTRAVREVRAVLTRARAMGLTRPGQVAAGLGEDFAVHRDDVPEEPEPATAGRDLPREVMSQLCGHLGAISSPEMRCGIELAIDTGRRPGEIATSHSTAGPGTTMACPCSYSTTTRPTASGGVCL